MGEVTKEGSFELLDTFYDLGGNFVDTANFYSAGESEEWLGEWLEKTGRREEMVIATKYSMNSKLGQPVQTSNYGGTGTKSMNNALRDSLKRLKTDYIDIVGPLSTTPQVHQPSLIEDVTVLRPRVGLRDGNSRAHALPQQPRHPGQGALPRGQQHPGLGGREGQRLRPPARPPPVLGLPGRVLGADAGPGARDHADVRRREHGDLGVPRARGRVLPGAGVCARREGEECRVYEGWERGACLGRSAQCGNEAWGSADECFNCVRDAEGRLQPSPVG